MMAAIVRWFRGLLIAIRCKRAGHDMDACNCEHFEAFYELYKDVDG